jgi:hypothetical protein
LALGEVSHRLDLAQLGLLARELNLRQFDGVAQLGQRRGAFARARRPKARGRAAREPPFGLVQEDVGLGQVGLPGGQVGLDLIQAGRGLVELERASAF